jgi:putative heme-binding domain-containing protein
VKFGTQSSFPEKYRRALFAMDWSYGRILAVHSKPEGASYSGDYEEFLKGKPLNVTDLEFGSDGAMYFITGGRGTQSGLYRVSYVGDATDKQDSPAQSESGTAAASRALRRELESCHGKDDPRAIEFAWPHLASPDRYIRYAARIAIESQDVALWQNRALSETNVQASLTALLALARCGDEKSQASLLFALEKYSLPSLNELQQLEKLRVIELSFIRQGRPTTESANVVLRQLDSHYPSPRDPVNRELAQLLIYLNAPDAIPRTLDLMAKAPTQEEQIHYAFILRNVTSGWTLDQRKQYFGWFANEKQTARLHTQQLVAWFKEAGRDYSNGSSYSKYLANIREEVIATLTDAEQAAVELFLVERKDAPPQQPGRERKFVKEWTTSDLEPLLDQVARDRDFESGKAAFNDAQCFACHRFGNEGGSVGPELAGAGSKYSRRDILESLLEPSKVVSDQFQNFIIVKKDGDDVVGRITDEDQERIIVLPNMLAPEATLAIPVADIASRQPSKISPMPSGLLNHLTQNEILDLLAYIETAGKAGAVNFQKQAAAN